jgi:hypothetical protein
VPEHLVEHYKQMDQESELKRNRDLAIEQLLDRALTTGVVTNVSEKLLAQSIATVAITRGTAQSVAYDAIVKAITQARASEEAARRFEQDVEIGYH